MHSWQITDFMESVNFTFAVLLKSTKNNMLRNYDSWEAFGLILFQYANTKMGRHNSGNILFHIWANVSYFQLIDIKERNGACNSFFIVSEKKSVWL